MLKVIDTNILLDFPQILEDEKDLIILTDVLKELDGLKLNQNPEIAFKARRAAITLSRHLDEIIWKSCYEDMKISVDDKLLLCAEESFGELITNDVYLKVKAIVKGVKTSGYGKTEDYSGIKTIYVATDENRYDKVLDYIFTNKALPDPEVKLYENEYIIVKDTNAKFLNKYGDEEYETLATFVYTNGEIKQFFDKGIKNRWIKHIKPRNPEQSCLFEALLDRSKTIIYAGGRFGSGKSYILNNFAIQELELGKIKKIVYVPNNAFTENTIELGALPGYVKLLGLNLVN